MEDEKNMVEPVAVVVAAVAASESDILIAAVKSINVEKHVPETEKTNALIAPVAGASVVADVPVTGVKINSGDTEAVEENDEQTQPLNISLDVSGMAAKVLAVEDDDEEEMEPLSISLDTSGDVSDTMPKEAGVLGIETVSIHDGEAAASTDANVAAVCISNDDDNLMDELHSGSFSVPVRVDEEEEEDEDEEEEEEEAAVEEDVDDEDLVNLDESAELIAESSDSSGSHTEDDMDDEIEEEEDDEDDTEAAVRQLPTANLSQAIEIDDDDEDEVEEKVLSKHSLEHRKDFDDEFDDDSENQSYSEDSARSSVQAIHDDDEDDDEPDEEFDRLKPIKITEVKTVLKSSRPIPVKPTIKKTIKFKKTMRQKLKAKSIKQLCRRMHDNRHQLLVTSKLQASVVEPIYIVKPNVSPYVPSAAITKEALRQPSQQVEVVKKPAMPTAVRVVEEIAMIVDSDDDDETETRLNGGTVPVAKAVAPTPAESTSADVLYKSSAILTPATLTTAPSTPSSAPAKPNDMLEPAETTALPLSTVAVTKVIAKPIEQPELCQQNGEAVTVPSSSIPADDIKPTAATPEIVIVPILPIATKSSNNSVAEAPTTVQSVAASESVNPPVIVDQRPAGARMAKKRGVSVSSEEMPPSKRLCAELEDNFGSHDRVLRDYIDKTSNNSADELQGHLDQLATDIKLLDNMALAKEMEWNHILHLKKVKEEIVLRLARRRTIMDIMATKVGGDGAEFSILDTQSPSLSKRITKELQHSMLLQHNNNNNNNTNNNIINSTLNASLNSVTMVPLVSSTPGSVSGSNNTTQSILNRVNMNKSDLAKQKAHTDKLHRNILPKPGHPSAVQQQHQSSSSSSSSPILNNYMITASKTAAASGATGNSATKPDVMDPKQRLQYQMQHQAFMSELLMNGGAGGSSAAGALQNTPIGRQGPIKDVKSIIDDYRQKHPESVPRRGRRLKGTFDSLNASVVLPTQDDDGPTVVSSSRRPRSTHPVYYDDAGRDSTRHQRRSHGSNAATPFAHLAHSDLSSFHYRNEGNSRPPSNGSSHSNSNAAPLPAAVGQNTAAFFNDLMEFAKYTQNNQLSSAAAAAASSAASAASSLPSGRTVGADGTNHNSSTPIVKPPPGYPEVTLHPVTAQLESVASATANATGAGPHNNSLLHGILTKVKYDTNPRPVAGYTSFAPTLARLLTAPERITPLANNIYPNHSVGPHQRPPLGAARTPPPTSSVKSEITITPVDVKPQTLLQQQLQRQHDSRVFMSNVDDEADDSVDRLVIDEGDHNDNSFAAMTAAAAASAAAAAAASQEDDTPECQGCKKREAQFVCAGCSNQWYCSRNCQVSAWDEHSEVCTG